MRKEKAILTNSGQGQATIYKENNELVEGTIDVPDWLAVGKYQSLNHNGSVKQAGFDLTNFHTIDNFLEILEQIGLDYCYDYYRVDMSDDDEEYYHYVWGNEDGMIVLGNNPITGEFRDGRYKKEGYGSYIGIEGSREFVVEAFEVIKENSKNKDMSPLNRDFI